MLRKRAALYTEAASSSLEFAMLNKDEMLFSNHSMLIKSQGVLLVSFCFFYLYPPQMFDLVFFCSVSNFYDPTFLSHWGIVWLSLIIPNLIIN